MKQQIYQHIDYAPGSRLTDLCDKFGKTGVKAILNELILENKVYTKRQCYYLAGVKLQTIQVELLLIRVNEILLRNPKQRLGQAFFNALSVTDFQLANEIRGGKFDPFWYDNKIDDMMKYVCDDSAHKYWKERKKEYDY
jgi:hypothetical protein